jgi:predicted ATPase with chaperone activity
MGTLMRSLFAVALMAAWYSSVPSANAQSAQREAPSPSPSSPAASITEQKLDAAAAALERVIGLQKTYEQRLAQAEQADRERIVAEANDALTKAVADQGLSVDEYSSILKMAQNDPEVRGKLLQRIHPPQHDPN